MVQENFQNQQSERSKKENNCTQMITGKVDNCYTPFVAGKVDNNCTPQGRSTMSVLHASQERSTTPQGRSTIVVVVLHSSQGRLTISVLHRESKQFLFSMCRREGQP